MRSQPRTIRALIFLALAHIFFLSSCLTIAAHSGSSPSTEGMAGIARHVAAQAGSGGAVITAGMKRIEKGLVLTGSCYDFANAVYVDAGFPESKRRSVYMAREAGPYADIALIRAGDWLYYDHMYAINADHSAIFVAWLNFDQHVALTIDYPGGNRALPGRYRVADLYKVWGITRPAS